METTPKLKTGEFAAMPNGERVFIEVLGVDEGTMPARVMVRWLDGDHAGGRGSCWVSSLKPLGPEIPIIPAT